VGKKGLGQGSQYKCRREEESIKVVLGNFKIIWDFACKIIFYILGVDY